MGVIPIVNENDTVATHEIEIGDNDTLSAIVASMIGADLLILLSDIDGLYTDDPRANPDAELIETVEHLDESFLRMGKSTTGSGVGTGGMSTKLTAATIATASGADMVIANSKDVPDYPPDHRRGELWNAVSGRKAGCLRSAGFRREPAQLP